jgi:hypothetical protein
MAVLARIEEHSLELSDSTKELCLAISSDPQLEQKIAKVWDLFKGYQITALAFVHAVINAREAKKAYRNGDIKAKVLRDMVSKMDLKFEKMRNALLVDPCSKLKLAQAAAIVLQGHSPLVYNIKNAAIKLNQYLESEGLAAGVYMNVLTGEVDIRSIGSLHFSNVGRANV